MRKVTGATTFEVGIFHQDINNYIFGQMYDNIDVFRYLIYRAKDATFTGIDGEISHRFDPAVSISLFGDYVRAKLTDEDENLPRIPPGRLGARYEGSWGPVSANLEYYHSFAQNRLAPLETRTDGYPMVNATLAYRFDIGGGRAVEFYARGTNLTNELAFVHTSFVKDQSPLRGRNIVLGMRHRF